MGQRPLPPRGPLLPLGCHRSVGGGLPLRRPPLIMPRTLRRLCLFLLVLLLLLLRKAPAARGTPNKGPARQGLAASPGQGGRPSAKRGPQGIVPLDASLDASLDLPLDQREPQLREQSSAALLRGERRVYGERDHETPQPAAGAAGTAASKGRRPHRQRRDGVADLHASQIVDRAPGEPPSGGAPKIFFQEGPPPKPTLSGLGAPGDPRGVSTERLRAVVQTYALETPLSALGAPRSARAASTIAVPLGMPIETDEEGSLDAAQEEGENAGEERLDGLGVAIEDLQLSLRRIEARVPPGGSATVALRVMAGAPVKLSVRLLTDWKQTAATLKEATMTAAGGHLQKPQQKAELSRREERNGEKDVREKTSLTLPFFEGPVEFTASPISSIRQRLGPLELDEGQTGGASFAAYTV
ncbi:subtilase family protein [Cyclospora cayetanensis]|uniref:Subtilase family protein n=1 Tax=Cyclospora cayetanensis TaxID=88456 RepID=A0A1D3CWM4_9EIME|nr:subtilase family protein [Cyclospora cayetanensis]